MIAKTAEIPWLESSAIEGQFIDRRGTIEGENKAVSGCRMGSAELTMPDISVSITQDLIALGLDRHKSDAVDVSAYFEEHTEQKVGKGWHQQLVLSKEQQSDGKYEEKDDDEYDRHGRSSLSEQEELEQYLSTIACPTKLTYNNTKKSRKDSSSFCSMLRDIERSVTASDPRKPKHQ